MNAWLLYSDSSLYSFYSNVNTSGPLPPSPPLFKFFSFFSLSEARVLMNNWTVPRSKCHSRENCLRWLVIRIFIVCYVGLRFLSFHIPPYLGDGRYRWAGLSGETLKVEMERWHGNTINLHTQHHPAMPARDHTHTHTHTLFQWDRNTRWSKAVRHLTG